MPSPLKPVVALVGPTAVGKTEWALEAASALGAEIVSVDSRQVYRGMDIGTAKPTTAERARVRHHLIDILEPGETLGLAAFLRLARSAIDDIHARGRLPLVVGGTGQYVWGLLEGWQVPAVPPAPERRAALLAEAERGGAQALHGRLAALDPEAAAWIDPTNVRRVVRALEVIQATGRTFTEQRRKAPPPYAEFIAGLWRPRPELYARIDARVDAMLAAGLVEEVRLLAAHGYGWDLPAMSGVGYRQIGQYLRGECTEAEAAALIKRATRRFARQQSTWFHHDDPRIHWFRPGLNTPADLVGEVRAWSGAASQPE